MEPQSIGPFTNNSLTGLLMMVTTGLTSTGFPDVSAGVVTITSSVNYSLTADENSGGTITSINVAGTYTVEPNGRVTLTSAGGTGSSTCRARTPATSWGRMGMYRPVASLPGELLSPCREHFT